MLGRRLDAGQAVRCWAGGLMLGRQFFFVFFCFILAKIVHMGKLILKVRLG